MAAGAAAAMRLATAGSLRPSPAAKVSAACRAGRSSSPTAAAMPPWAQAEAAPSDNGTLASRMTGRGAEPQRGHQPGKATADDDGAAGKVGTHGLHAHLP